MSETQQLHHHVTEVLRDKIVDGILRSGTPISERELCEELGVSRTPLREALKVLASEGLVELFRNRGAVVSSISVEMIEDKLAVIAALEGFAVRQICLQASDEQLNNLKELSREFSRKFASGEPERHFDLNQAFHHKLVEMTGNAVLIDMHTLLSRHVRRARMEGVRHHVPAETVLEEHEAILKALLARDGISAQMAVEQHLRRVAQTVVQYFRSK